VHVWDELDWTIAEVPQNWHERLQSLHAENHVVGAQGEAVWHMVGKRLKKNIEATLFV
jgi:hypothetical protein